MEDRLWVFLVRILLIHLSLLIGKFSPSKYRFIYLLSSTWVACRFFMHATLFSCAVCPQREAGIHGPLTQEASVGCIWDDYATLPAIKQDKDETLSQSTTFWIRRQRSAEFVERFWLNDQEWFQISPRSFVVFLFSCVALACLSGGALNSGGVFASIGSKISKSIAFYITMAFTFVSTGHTPAGESPKLMFIPLGHNFLDWKATAKAIIVTMLVHASLVFSAFPEVDPSFATPLACTIMAPLLLAGISSRSYSMGQQGNREPGPEQNTGEVRSDEPPSSIAKAWTIDSTLVYSSSRFRCLDLRVLLLGLSVALFDVLCNQFQDEMSVTRWPISAVVAISVTAIWLFLENMVSTSREIEPGFLCLTAAALVGIFGHVNFLDAFGLYDNEWEDEDLTQTMPVPEDASHLKPIMIALWYTTLISMVGFNRRLVHLKADQRFPATNGQPPKKSHLLFGFHVKTSRINFSWQLRDSGVAISLVFTMLASCISESWPLDMNTTVAGLLLFALVIGFHLRPKGDHLGEKRSLRHVAALVFSALMTILAVGLSRHGVLNDFESDSKNDWKSGSWSAVCSYRLFVVVSIWLEDNGWCLTRRIHVEKLPSRVLPDEDKVAVEEEEQQRAINSTAKD